MGTYLRKLLEGEDGRAPLSGNVPERWLAGISSDSEYPSLVGQSVEPQGFVKYCEGLPYAVQMLIAENFDAFCDNYLHPLKGVIFSFLELADTMNFFRQLSETGQKRVQAALEKDAFAGFSDGAGS